MEFYRVNHNITWDDLEIYNYPNRKVGVIIYIVDDEGRVLLQQRGIKSRDEKGLYECVGGKVEESDLDFKSAIIREMNEEMGNNIEIHFDNSYGIWHVKKNDINWLFIVFLGKYISGKPEIMEPDKCQEYKFFEYDEAINSNMLSESCKFLVKTMKKEYR